MTKAKRFILASTSPFRKKILEDAGYSFTCIGAKGDEKTIAGLPPKLLAAKRAEFKAIDVALHAPPDSMILGADQVLSLDGESFDKASTDEEAKIRLRHFRGKTHYLHSAICLVEVHPSGSCETLFETVVDVPMTMRLLSDDEIEAYVATGEWQGSVGCYRIEGEGQKLFTATGGDHTAIIGLPMTDLKAALTALSSR